MWHRERLDRTSSEQNRRRDLDRPKPFGVVRVIEGDDADTAGLDLRERRSGIGGPGDQLGGDSRIERQPPVVPTACDERADRSWMERGVEDRPGATERA